MICSRKKFETEKRKSNINFLLMKLNTKPLKFEYGLADRGGGGGLVDPCKAWVPPPSKVSKNSPPLILG
jgi:hypothetical protein